ncbi:MAG: DUF4381 domain-containing protein [Alphaproteobacteria bacterium]|nr:DUF4381 domain-containing protein [Alphaproteobacteria bacterium]
MNNLPELRDIHLPAENISVFPLAGGWWFCILAILLLVFGGKMFFAARRAGAKFYARYLIEHQAKNNDISAVIKMSEILRRICVKQYPQAVSLSGDEWINFLQQKSKSKILQSAAQLLKNAPYIRQSEYQINTEDVKNLREFCLRWVGENL